ncbi:E3 ubiquitin-protein ligase RNF25 [Cloeon dipterum]|uniref:E3 ubiquitin-protein ligase RNF25 n=1 Tax=Cloeon dipterum TaxID=197152 RepID=UPI00321FAEBD
MDERVNEEIEALTAILMDEVKVSQSEESITVETVLFPSTAADEEQQYVTVTLAVDLPAGYPDQSPIVRLKKPRGLDDDLLSKILTEAKAKCHDYLGQPVIYELIELVREHLTCSNTPSCHCAICLYGFRDEDEFTKTPCFHHFHAHCLASYVRSYQETQKQEKEKVPLWQRLQHKDSEDHDCVVPCPVCRESLSCQLDRLASAAPPKDVQDALNFQLTDELKELQTKMASLFLYQQQKGGIIDPEADDSKLLLVTQTTSNEEQEVVPPPVPAPATQPPASGFKPQAPGSRSWKRGGGGGHHKAGGSSRGQRGGRGRERRNQQNSPLETAR